MSQLVFIHGPGAGGCAAGFRYQLNHFPGSLAPTLPGHPDGAPCDSVQRYTDWLRGWLWARERRRDLVLVGFTLGASIALQYALDYADDVQCLVLMTVAMQPKQRAPGTLELRLRAAADPAVHEEWLDAMRHVMQHVAPELREELIACHRQVGPLSQHHDLTVIDQFDVRDRITTLAPPLLLIRGLDDPSNPPLYEEEMHRAVPGSRYVTLQQAGHFPMAEQPEQVNQLIQSFLEQLPTP
jgi:pimeloyl-ACP methyl ester carboxylesterase